MGHTAVSDIESFLISFPITWRKEPEENTVILQMFTGQSTGFNQIKTNHLKSV